MHEPYLRGCVSAQNELSLAGVGSDGDPACRVFKVTDLPAPERAQLRAGLPRNGTLDEAENEVKALANRLLPVRASVGTSTPQPQPGGDCRQP